VIGRISRAEIARQLVTDVGVRREQALEPSSFSRAEQFPVGERISSFIECCPKGMIG